MYTLQTEQKLRVIAALLEGNSIRSIERITGVHRDTICRLLVATGKTASALLDAHLQNLKCRFIQCDEIWTFVGKKARRVRDDDSPELGDQWVFVAMDEETKLIPSYVVGKRTAVSTYNLIHDLAQRITNRPQITTDGFRFYIRAIEDCFGADVDFAQLVKLYGDFGQHDSETKYSPSPILEIISKIYQGNPQPERICTSHVERQNLTMRMQMRRFTRLTNAYSKKLENLKAACALHFAHYNFCRIHQSLRVTPAMAANVTNHVWSLETLLQNEVVN